MANGLYGQTIPANVTSDDIEIWYSFSENRNSSNAGNATFKKLESNILRQQTREVNGLSDNILEGAYKLNLPLNIFNKKGFYTVYIKPKEIHAKILDVSTLAEFEDINGIVISTSSISSAVDKNLLKTNNSLVGYRIVYIGDSGNREDYYRIITSNNRCEPVVKQMTNTSSRTTRYRYNNSSNLSFITLTPSMSTNYTPSLTPFIGNVNQDILLVNTKFTPVMLDIELTEHDVETITTMLEGSQTFNNENGLVSTFNKDGEIYHQAQTYLIKNDYTGEPIKKVKETKYDNIDFNETLE